MLAEVIARQEIEYLRRLYARATDLIGTGDEQAKSQGLAIYERIFTPDVTIRTTGNDTPYEATGASDWARLSTPCTRHSREIITSSLFITLPVPA